MVGIAYLSHLSLNTLSSLGAAALRINCPIANFDPVLRQGLAAWWVHLFQRVGLWPASHEVSLSRIWLQKAREKKGCAPRRTDDGCGDGKRRPGAG